MPRKPRFNLIGLPQHVIQCGNNREPCFFSEQDYRRYLEASNNRAREQFFQIFELAYIRDYCSPVRISCFETKNQ